MAVLSIREFLADHSAVSTNPNVLLQACTLLLEGVARHALSYDREDYEQFRLTLRQLALAMQSADQDAQILAVAGDSVAAIEDYNREAQRIFGEHSVELRSMIEMLSRTLVGLADAGGQSVNSLQKICDQIESASRLNDIRLLRARLGDSLRAISQEAKLQRERSARMLEDAEAATVVAMGRTAAEGVDRISGLAGLEKATGQITAHLGPASTFFAVVFLLERVDVINLRYGFEAGDQLLQAFSQHLACKLSPQDQLYRWRGPTFVALLDRPCPAEGVRAEIARFASVRQEQAISLKGQQLRLPMTCAWAVVPLATCEIAENVSQQLDRFVAERSLA